MNTKFKTKKNSTNVWKQVKKGLLLAGLTCAMGMKLAAVEKKSEALDQNRNSALAEYLVTRHVHEYIDKYQISTQELKEKQEQANLLKEKLKSVNPSVIEIAAIARVKTMMSETKSHVVGPKLLFDECYPIVINTYKDYLKNDASYYVELIKAIEYSDIQNQDKELKLSITMIDNYMGDRMVLDDENHWLQVLNECDELFEKYEELLKNLLCVKKRWKLEYHREESFIEYTKKNNYRYNHPIICFELIRQHAHKIFQAVEMGCTEDELWVWGIRTYEILKNIILAKLFMDRISDDTRFKVKDEQVNAKSEMTKDLESLGGLSEYSMNIVEEEKSKQISEMTNDLQNLQNFQDFQDLNSSMVFHKKESFSGLTLEHFLRYQSNLADIKIITKNLLDHIKTALLTEVTESTDKNPNNLKKTVMGAMESYINRHFRQED